MKGGRPGVRVSIRWIVTLVAVALTTTAVLSIGVIGERSTRRALTSEIEMRILLDARMLATASSSAMLGDFPELTLHPLVRQMRERQPELCAAVVVDKAGVILGDADPRALGTKHIVQAGMTPVTPLNALAAGEELVGDGRVILARCAVTHPNGRQIGTAMVGVPRGYVDGVLAEARRRQLLVLGAFLLAGIATAFVLMSQLLKPVAVLRKGIERIGRGDWDTPLDLRDGTELSLLGSAINDMAAQLKRAQRHLLKKNRELRRANRNLKELDRLKSEFLRNVNHELRTPLTVIIAYLSFLQSRNEAPADQAMLRETIEVTLKEAWRLHGMLEDLLEFAAASTDSLQVSVAPEDLAILLGAYHADRVAHVAGGQREFVFEAETQVPLAMTDRKRLTQVLDSLLDNAVKFTPEGTRICLRLGAESSPEASWVSVRLEDNGPGVAPEDIPDLFRSFQQLDGSTTREVGGMGLGLALTKSFMEKMGGSIQATSEVGRGTAFTLLLPVADGEARAGAPEPRRRAPS